MPAAESSMLVTDFDFALPDDLIAQTALPRGQSRLFVLDRTTGAVAHRTIADLPAFSVAAISSSSTTPASSRRGCWVTGFPAVGQSSACC